MAGGTGDILSKAATEYVTAKAGQMIGNLGDRVSGTAPKKDKGSKDDSGGEEKGFVGTAAQKLGEGASPIKAAFSGMGSAVKKFFTRKGGSKRPTNIVEDAVVGVTPDVAFAAWTQFEEFPSFMKGPEAVSRGEEKPEEELEEGQHPLEGEETNWTAKVFINRRQWKATTVDYDPPRRLSWTTEGAKGTIDGTVSFIPLGDNGTHIVMVLEYRPKGLIEWIGNRWRAVPRRAKLDLKHYRRYVMRTEPDDLPEPEEADEIPEEAKGEDAANAEVEEGQEGEGSEQSEESDDENVTDETGEDGTDETDEEPESEEDEEPTDEEEPEAEDESEESDEEEPEPEPEPQARRPRPARASA